MKKIIIWQISKLIISQDNIRTLKLIPFYVNTDAKLLKVRYETGALVIQK